MKTQPVPRADSAWLTPHEAAAYLRVASTRSTTRAQTVGLKHTKLGYRTIRLKRAWIDEWAESRKPAGR